MQTRKISGF